MNLKRRDFLKIVGAATVATNLPGCTPKQPKSLLPYVIPEEEIIPGRSVWYASVCRECPAGCGVQMRVREGRATKAEGNALHPVNKGALCARGQASLQGLYNPDRIQTPMRRKSGGGWEPLDWQGAGEYLVSRLKDIRKNGGGSKIAFVSQHITGSLDALVDDWLGALGSTRRFRYEPFAYEAVREANKRTFGRDEIPTFDFSGVRTVYSFGTDFLETWVSPVEYARQFSAGRGREDQGRVRFVYIGPRLSMTAANADRWVNVHPDMLGNLALAFVQVILAEDLGTQLSAREKESISRLVRGFAPDQISWPTGLPVDQITNLARAFAASKTSLAVAGGCSAQGEFGVQVNVAVNLLNYVCGNVGRSIRFGPVNTLSNLSRYAEIENLLRSMERDEVSALVLSDVNPAHSVPAAAGVAAAMAKVPFVVSCASFMDETAALAHLILPTHTRFESWGDFEPQEGVHGLMQPVMQPVFDTKMLGDILLASGRQLSSSGSFEAPSFHAYVKDRWKTLHAKLGRGVAFEPFWIESLARGGVWEKVASRKVSLVDGLSASAVKGPGEVPARTGNAFTLLAYPSISTFDGRGANRPWLQEFPDPMTRQLWGTWVEIGQEDATRLGIAEGDRVQVTSPYGRYELPAHVYRGLRSGYVAIPLGQGHSTNGRYASGVGANAFALLDPKASPDGSGGLMLLGTEIELLKLSGTLQFATVQESESQERREILQEIPLVTLLKGSSVETPDEPSLYPEQTYPQHQWGMTIDLDKCTGCGACVTSCYAENNIPVVGKDEVVNGREMAWIRIDRYYRDRPSEPKHPGEEEAGFIPVLCQQCGDAPCETVCPVYAAYHTEEGLNGQVYNRCIGTRYCANNCPYKVRRFNWFEHEIPEPLNWQLNPDVTVRSKGVMEKCTFCIQRIVEGKNNARMERRNVMDGEIKPACQQTCPAQAIVFGDLKNPESAVSKLSSRDEPRQYHVLEELNTRPAVTYLKKIRITDEGA
jgi:molybdopterin-containing oxidoreductase family iron-sulfur binding subunit